MNNQSIYAGRHQIDTTLVLDLTHRSLTRDSKHFAYLSLSLVLTGSGIMDSDDINILPGRDLARFPSGVCQ